MTKAPPEKMATEEVLRIKLETLKSEHRDLDEAIGALEERDGDTFAVRRLKKQKLQLKDKIADDRTPFKEMAALSERQDELEARLERLTGPEPTSVPLHIEKSDGSAHLIRRHEWPQHEHRSQEGQRWADRPRNRNRHGKKDRYPEQHERRRHLRRPYAERQ